MSALITSSIARPTHHQVLDRSAAVDSEAS